MFAAKNEFFTPSQGYQISRSVRLRSSASAYFNRTPASAGNRKTWTWSGWVKRGTLGVISRLFAADDGSASTDQDYNSLLFNSSNQLQFSGNLTDFRITTAVYRDPSAWYHIVLATDTTQATAANRFKLYVNGSEVTAFGTSNNPSQNTDLAVNASIGHYIGSIAGSSYLDGYLTEVNFIDGQALTPTSFGQFNSVTGVWQPLKYTGTYGTNGFYLNFSDNSNNTATTIGKDYSGNGNNWTPNNISVTSGTTYDSMLDVPTPYADGNSGRGNYAVLNPIGYDNATNTINDGNLKVAWTSGGNSYKASTIGMTSGKWYCEFYIDVVSTAAMPGLVNDLASMGYPGNNGTGNGYGYYYDGQKYTAGTGTAYGSSYTSGDVIGIAYDADSGKLWFSKNGTWQASGDPAAGTNAAFTGLSTSRTWFFVAGHSGSATMTANFGQRPFTYTPPSGFKALNTQNLPSPTISNGALYMAATTYTATGSTPQTINNGTNNTIGTTFKPDLVWTKSRSAVFNNVLNDSVRGAQYYLYSNLTNAEVNDATYLTAFNSNGFSLGTGNFTNGTTMVGWQWQAGAGTTSSNTSGSITSTVSVNATAGFSVVTCTTPASGAFTIGHGLGVAPSMIIVKDRANATGWPVYHASVTTQNEYLLLNTTAAKATLSGMFGAAPPTSTVFGQTVGAGVNANIGMVAYCFSAVAGYSAFGSYTGNGSTTYGSGPFIYTGFRPRLVMCKNTTTAGGGWEIFDTSRNPYNVSTVTMSALYANSSGAEDSTYQIMILSNGFSVNGSNANLNSSGDTFIYMAFAENPYKLALAR